MPRACDDGKDLKERLKNRMEKIESMPKDQLIEQLRLRNLHTEGVKKVLKKRLRLHDERTLKKNIQNRELPKNIPEMLPTKTTKKVFPPTRFFVVIDFEATCVKDKDPSFKHEIIEFPAVLVDAQNMAITKEFHSYVRPTINPVLTEFCTKLTGIQQKTVDEAPEFPQVLSEFEEWLNHNQLGRRNILIVTDGFWDMGKFMYLQCKWSGLRLPRWSRRWLDVRRAFSGFYKRRKVNLAFMLRHLRLTFQGRQHSGIDDSRNIAQVLLCLMRDGCDRLTYNQEVYQKKISVTNYINRIRAEEEEEEEEVEEEEDKEEGEEDEVGKEGEEGEEEEEEDEEENELESSWKEVGRHASFGGVEGEAADIVERLDQSLKIEGSKA